jgi:hypothetical protein
MKTFDFCFCVRSELLKNFKELFDEGLITEAEYEQKKNEVYERKNKKIQKIDVILSSSFQKKKIKTRHGLSRIASTRNHCRIINKITIPSIARRLFHWRTTSRRLCRCAQVALSSDAELHSTAARRSVDHHNVTRTTSIIDH